MLGNIITKYFNANVITGRGFAQGKGTVLATSKGALIKIGEHTHVGRNCFIQAGKKITIGSNTMLADNVFVTDATHGYKDLFTPFIEQPNEFAETKIGNGCWLGRNVCVLPGVTIGDNVLVGANSVVTHDLPSHCIAVGSPARVIKQATEEERSASSFVPSGFGYDDWAAAQAMELLERKRVQELNGRMFYDLFAMHAGNINAKDVAEIGGAEGHTLATFSRLADIKGFKYNLELSDNWREHCNPNVTFVQYDLLKDEMPKVDLVVLSDIVEHVADDRAFLRRVSTQCKYSLIKIPIENTWYTKWLRRLGKAKPVGAGHPSGHLHEYTGADALNLVHRSGHDIMAFRYVSLAEFIKPKNLAQRILVKLARKYPNKFGGAMLILAKRREAKK